MIIMKGKYNQANIFVKEGELDDTTKVQIQGFLNHPAFGHTYIAIMPDCHAGAGAVIGLTMKMNDYVIPNVVGVDLGCGVLAVNIGMCSSFSLEKLDDFIKTEIPSGFHINEKATVTTHDKELGTSFDGMKNVCLDIGYDDLKAYRSIGSLGGGNHFIELDLSDDGSVWVVVHSGSRNFGLSVANFYQQKAKEQLEKYFIKEEYKGLEFLSRCELDAKHYEFAMTIAQNLAEANRREIMRRLLRFFGVGHIKERIESVHNYIDFDDGIIRKGAIKAAKDMVCVIPFNMKDGLAVCVGKGSSKWNNSAPHGAGRILSRKKAKENLSLESFQKEMKDANIFTTTATKATLDEAPGAYKDKDFILKAIEETVEIREMLKPIYNFKATE